MPSEKVGELYVEIEARLADLERDLRKAEQKVADAQNKINKQAEQANPFGGIVTLGAKVLATMGAVELGIKSAAVAADLLQGNFENGWETLKQLPAGIGGVFQGIEQVNIALGGSVNKAEALQQHLEDTTRLFGGLTALTNSFTASFDGVDRAIEDITRQIDLIGAEPVELEIAAAESGLTAVKRSIEDQVAAIAEAASAQLAEISSEQFKLQNQSGGPSLDDVDRIEELQKQYDAITRTVQQRQDELRAKGEQVIEAATELYNKQAEAAQRAADIQVSINKEAARSEQQRVDEAFAKTVKDLDSQVIAAELSLAGDDLGANIERVRRMYESLSESASTYAEKERLETLKSLEIQKLKLDEAEKIADEQAKAAEEAARNQIGRAVEVTGQRLSAAGIGLEAATKKQQVEDPQLATTNELLQESVTLQGQMATSGGFA